MPEDSEKKGPKLFRPGQTPPKDEESKDAKPTGPKVFKPGAAPSGEPAPTAAPAPAKAAGPKLFKPSAPSAAASAAPASPAPATPAVSAPAAEPVKSSGPKLFKPAAASTPAPPTEKTPEAPKPVIAYVPTPAPPMAPAPAAPEEIPKQVVKPKRGAAMTETAPAPAAAPAYQPPAATPEPKMAASFAPSDTTAPPSSPIQKPTRGAALTEFDKGSAAAPKLVPTPPAEKHKRGSMKPEPQVRAKKERPKRASGGFIREQLFGEVDVREMWYKSIIAGFFACISMVFVSYIVYAFSGDSILNQTNIFTVYAQGNVANEFVSLWTVTYTPVTLLKQISATWMDFWYIYLAPVLFAALLISFQIRNVKYSILSVFFFIMFAIIIPAAFLVLFPVFQLVEPSSVDAGINSVFPGVAQNWSNMLATISDGTNSIFFAWCFGGALELALVLLIFVLPLSIIFALFGLIFKKK